MNNRMPERMRSPLIRVKVSRALVPGTHASPMMQQAKVWQNLNSGECTIE
jgi:hypothetical protein